MKSYVKPTCEFVRLNMSENIATSSTNNENEEENENEVYQDNEETPVSSETEDEAAEVPQEALTVIELDEDPSAGEKNRDMLNDAIYYSDGMTVKLSESNKSYPIKPSINLSNCKLDMNGCKFYTTEFQGKDPLIIMSYASEICNGELEGSYKIADDEPGYSFYENEKLIGINEHHVTEITIHDMDIHNCWGFAICPHGGADFVLSNAYTENERVSVEGDWACWRTRVYLDGSNIKGKQYANFVEAANTSHPFMSASGGLGYNPIISWTPIKYVFHAEGENDKIFEMIPKNKVYIPIGTDYVDIFTTIPADKDKIIPWNITLGDCIANWIDIYNCEIHNNSSLGIVGCEETMEISHCRFYEQGKPRKDATMSKRNTVGAIDVEDIATPMIRLICCDAMDDPFLLLDGSYTADIKDCRGNVSAYRGWNLFVVDHYGSIKHSSATSKKDIHVNGLSIPLSGFNTSSINVNPSRMYSRNVKAPLCTPIQYYEEFEAYTSYSANIVDFAKDDSAPIGSIVAKDMTGTLRIKLATKDRNVHGLSSCLGLEEYMVDDAGKKYGSIAAWGDCHNIMSNAPILPNGYVLNKCGFTITEDYTLGVSICKTANQNLCGEYRNCFIHYNKPMFRTIANPIGLSRCEDPVNLIFDGCNIRYGDAEIPMFQWTFPANSTVTFINCTLNGLNMSDVSSDVVTGMFSNITNVSIKIF